ncbi:MAG: endonuclease domain-containing protein [Rehaibacterium terrae]|uniref:endonuclease domain-containing protein n=1 Tax=Rehaibacterium terrae TaxID=1341696 RepID=UPI00391B2EF5
MRGNATDAECKLWQRLRAGQLNGPKFRRQHPIPPYIVDFFCGGAGLAIELDGSQHGDEADAARTRYLESKGLRVLRFRDNDVLLNTDAVLEAMLNAVGDRTLTPPPLPAGEGL